MEGTPPERGGWSVGAAPAQITRFTGLSHGSKPQTGSHAVTEETPGISEGPARRTARSRPLRPTPPSAERRAGHHRAGLWRWKPRPPAVPVAPRRAPTLPPPCESSPWAGWEGGRWRDGAGEGRSARLGARDGGRARLHGAGASPRSRCRDGLRRWLRGQAEHGARGGAFGGPLVSRLSPYIGQRGLPELRQATGVHTPPAECPAWVLRWRHRARIPTEGHWGAFGGWCCPQLWLMARVTSGAAQATPRNLGLAVCGPRPSRWDDSPGTGASCALSSQGPDLAPVQCRARN